MALPQDLADRLSLPLIAAPMFLVSGPDLVVEACRAGVIGAFPTVNCRSVAELDAWLLDMQRRVGEAEQRAGRRLAPICPNVLVHPSNTRRDEDVRLLTTHRVELVIASVGNPAPVIPALHDAGCRVFADVASLRHAEKAIEAGSDGLVLLTAGAGGRTGWANPFAFVRAVRAMWQGPIVLAGGISDGQALFAARALGCDLAYMGTRFIATRESMAPQRYKDMLVTSRLDDVLLTKAMTGLETNILRPSLLAAGLDPDNLPARGAIDVAKDINRSARDQAEAGGTRRWKDIWSAGHSVSGVGEVAAVADLVARTAEEFAAARRAAV
ncbi:MAG: nitronate monooxygenase [Alphaproteobacteria bacterium]|nr:nitronate monooxygenase [Alphaproteobacteria bacterium]